MGSIINYIAKETSGNSFTSFKYCFDGQPIPHVEYESAEDSYVNLKDFAEEVHDPKVRDLTSRAQISMQGPPLFKYFLDGSRKVYKIDDIQYDRKVYPVLSGQVSVACCARTLEDDIKFSSFVPINLEAYSVICLPVTANSVGAENIVFFNNLLNKLKNLPATSRCCLELKKILYYLTKLDGKETLESKGIARIQDEMIECEKRIVARLMGKHLLNQNHYLIKDGSIQYKPMKTGDYKEIAHIKTNYRHVVGVSKSFNPNLMKDNKDQSSAATIAKLPLYHRTPAFLWQPGSEWGNVNYAIWYVRIRDRLHTETPYSGILKIEKMLMTEQEAHHGLDTEEIDNITANIINERNPVCYGNDARWANHLYPVYMTECYCKSKFQNDYSFINLF
ncbi:hypothetical protein [Bacteroides intestinalis]|jgi:hypothetical protein|uniref:hypothetical protein n=1 Tax=Bacteroides intestinalis TaxID=329854 RepID=UPI0018A03293|nr:hypothetical protein [Bacteroides intestinalis]MBS6563525.1 hypothetical protein [Staphylococcus sp.]